MSDKSGIEWTEATWNPATGCTKVSSGCKFCYAKHKAWPRLSKNPKGVYTGRKFEDVQVHPERLDQPLRWTKPRMIFVNSMSDLFHEDIPDAFIWDVFGVMSRAQRHIFQVLTKRPERMRAFINHVQGSSMGLIPSQPVDTTFNGAPWPLPNVWLGVSVENQETADERIPCLLETPAAIRWLSCEPLLDRIVIAESTAEHTARLKGAGIHWVVVGGESGTNARPMPDGAATLLANECKQSGIPFFFKQGGQANWPAHKDFDSFPTALQVREYPK